MSAGDDVSSQRRQRRPLGAERVHLSSLREHSLLPSLLCPSPAAPLTWEVLGPPGWGSRLCAADGDFPRPPRAATAAAGSFQVPNTRPGLSHKVLNTRAS
ncbi:hypothetical protein HispidOSU_014898 [Sigmodon hispidus]